MLSLCTFNTLLNPRALIMNLELHHFFILVEPKAEAAEVLVSLGMKERAINRDHKGQGTSNRCFDFLNGTLELLWVRDEQEAFDGPAKNLNLPERSKSKSASPFGIILNRKDNTSLEMPFEGWEYHPDYFGSLGSPWFFHVGINSSNLNEPLCFYVPFVEPKAKSENTNQSVFKNITLIKVHTPSNPVSSVLKAVNKADRLSILNGEHLMEVVFNGHGQGVTKDLRPYLPLIIHW